MSETMYYGEKPIVKIEDGYTPTIKRVTFADGAEDLPTWDVDVVASPTPLDPSEVRNRRGIYVVGKALELLKSLDVRVEEIPYYIQKLVASLEDNEAFLWLKIFNRDSKYEVRLSDWTKLFDKD